MNRIAVFDDDADEGLLNPRGIGFLSASRWRNESIPTCTPIGRFLGVWSCAASAPRSTLLIGGAPDLTMITSAGVIAAVVQQPPGVTITDGLAMATDCLILLGGFPRDWILHIYMESWLLVTALINWKNFDR